MSLLAAEESKEEKRELLTRVLMRQHTIDCAAKWLVYRRDETNVYYLGCGGKLQGLEKEFDGIATEAEKQMEDIRVKAVAKMLDLLQDKDICELADSLSEVEKYP